MSSAPQGQKTGSKSPSSTGGRFRRAALHLFSCCLIRFSSVLVAASGGKPSVPLRWAQLVLCDSRQLSVTLSHARADKSLCFGELFSGDANCIILSNNIEDIRPNQITWWIFYTRLSLKKRKKYWKWYEKCNSHVFSTMWKTTKLIQTDYRCNKLVFYY